jgi:hypothetical protein
MQIDINRAVSLHPVDDTDHNTIFVSCRCYDKSKACGFLCFHVTTGHQLARRMVQVTHGVICDIKSGKFNHNGLQNVTLIDL